MSEIVSVVLGTAGHIDHGKSSLVRRLTGVDPDRLKEEKERELTIDLGFAPYQLPDGRTVGIVDVPGHERFIKNMVAGASGVDLVMLVVAADDGVMPQTREHLEILTLLGIEHGLVVITKIDLPGVDEELVEILELELEELLAGTFLANAPVCKVSSATGDGFDRLREILHERVYAAADADRQSEGAFRMPIQRVFSARGFGTILTGIPLSGELGAGDTVEVVTAGKTFKGRIRGLQAYGHKVERVRAGHSSALNVTDVDRKQVRRGDSVCTPGIFSAHAMLEGRLSLLPSQTRPLRQRETVRVHVGTSEVLGEVILLDHKVLSPGEDGLCQLRLREPLVTAPGDRFVLRRHSPMETLGGGTILGSSRWRLKPFKGFVLERLGKEESVLGDATQTLVLALDTPRKLGELVKEVGRPKREIQGLLTDLVASGEVQEVSGGKGQPIYLSAAGFGQTAERVEKALARFHAERPLREGCPRLDLRGKLELSDGLLQRCLDDLCARGAAKSSPAGYALAAHEVVLSEVAQRFHDDLLALYQETAFTTPTWPQALEKLTAEPNPEEDVLAQADAEDLFQNLLDAGDLVLVGDDLVFHRDRYQEAKDKVRTQIEANGPMSAAVFKECLNSSRRYTIPLLEHFDEIGLTRRDGNVRVLRG